MPSVQLRSVESGIAEIFWIFIGLGLICLVVPFTVLISAGYVHEDAVSSMRYVWFFFALATILWKIPILSEYRIPLGARIFKTTGTIWVLLFSLEHYFPEKLNLELTPIPTFLDSFVERYGFEFLFLIVFEIHMMISKVITTRADSAVISYLILYDISFTFLVVLSDNLFIKDFPPPEIVLWILGISSTFSLFPIENVPP